MYTVKAGDTLSKLYGANWKQLSGYTGDPTKLQIGTQLPDLPGTEKPTLESIGAGVQKVAEQIPAIQTGISELPEKPIAPEPEAKDITLGTTEITVPTGGTGANTDAYNKGLLADLDAMTKRWQDAEQKRLDDLAKQKADTETKISDLETKQAVMTETNIQPLLQPFREELQKTQREELHVKENLLANQTSISELNALATQAQTSIGAIESQPGLGAIKSGQIAKIQESVTARAGIIQAVISTRANNITQSYQYIDQSISAIEADRKDQLTYYQAVYDMYEKQKDTAGNKLITLEKDEKDYIDNQISFLKDQVKISQDTVNMVKEAMMNPATASIYEQAGITLTDSPAQIQKKLADYSYRQEVTEIQNKMELDGYEYLPLGAGTKPVEEITTMTDSKGKTYTFWKKPEAITTTGGGIVFQDSTTGEQYDLSTVDGLKKFKTAHPDYTFEDMDSWMDTNVKSLDATTRRNLLDAAGFVKTEQMKITMTDETHRNEIKLQIKKGLSKEDIKVLISVGTKATQADKDRALKLLDGLYPEEMSNWIQKTIDEPNKYKIQGDGTYEIKWGPWPNKLVYKFPE